MQADSGFGDILALVRDLRVRCEFDRALTLDSLRPYLREEVAELEEALDHADEHRIAAELGDILLHCAFQIVLAEERGTFGLADVTRGLVTKMKARHPHLYHDGDRPDWERAKVEERRREAERLGRNAGVLGRLPPGLPELERAYRYQERAASIGFDWADVAGTVDKLEEEVREARSHPEKEIGDVLFAAVNVARKAGTHPSTALRCATEKFRRRFAAMEALAAQRGIDLATAGLQRLDGLWEEVKGSEG